MANCGGGGEGDQPAAEAEKPAQGEGMTITADMTAAVTGTVHFKGEAPQRRPIQQDRECRALHDEQFLS
ncbi:MAG: hypothetical protein GWN00_32690, partial [Aliifodinibius sp.]|nr:hypothetical protein [Fodinibius sp.]NIX00532.1 hypothetical protein [Phycisphaerae bacterium]NIY29375.1 hypothetical protein [Fodinibius sp.]